MILFGHLSVIDDSILSVVHDGRLFLSVICDGCFCLIRFFTSHQQSFSHIGTGLPWLNQYQARIYVLAQGHN